MILRVARAIFLLCIATLVGCGGGGESSTASSSAPGAFRASFSEPVIEAVGVEGTPQAVQTSARISATGDVATQGVYLRVGGDEALVQDVQGYLGGFEADELYLTLTMRGDLAPGDYSSEIVLYACFDEACTRSPTGSPVRVPLHFRVLPNIHVQPRIELGRQGRDPAPESTVSVTIPPEAGTVSMEVANDRRDAVTVSFDGNSLKVSTRQVPAGQYRATVVFRSSSDARYAQTVEVAYTVTAPPGGEEVLSVADPYRQLSLRQGAGTQQRLLVTRPTWTDAWESPQIYSDSAGLLTLTPTPDGHYSVAINTAGVPPGYYQPTIRFAAGPTGGTAFASFNISVQDSYYVDGTLQHTLTATSIAADLQWSNPVLTFDGVPARWTAVSQSPLLQVVNGSGTTGVDPLRLRVDPAVVGQLDWQQALPVTLSIDRPGTLPQVVQVSIANVIPTLQAALPSTLVGSSGRVYIEGNFRNFDGDPLAANRLRVEGATLSHGRLVADPRSLADLLVLELDLTGAVPGQPVRVHVDSALQPSQVELQVQMPLRAAGGYQVLPYGAYSPGQYSPSAGAFYFSKPGMVYRWGRDAGGWSLSQAAVSGLLDVAPGADDRQLFAVTPTQLIGLHPLTLEVLSAAIVTDWGMSPLEFDMAADGARGLVFSADGRALASINDGPNSPDHNVGTICLVRPSRAAAALTDAPQSCDPGSGKGYAAGPTNSGVIRSPNGRTVAGTNPAGRRSTYRAAERYWAAEAPLPAGLTLLAVSDSGSRLVRSDGMLIDAEGAALGNLGAIVPFTHRVGGYGLSSGGRYGFVYGYQLTGSGAAQRATDATLWVVDLDNAAGSGVATAPVVATLTLPSPVGCTSSLAEGESCLHKASIGVAPGDGTAFIVGPRGVLAVALPAGVTSAQPSSWAVRPGMRRSSGARPASSLPSRGRFEPAR